MDNGAPGDGKCRCRRIERDRVPLIDEIARIYGAETGRLVVPYACSIEASRISKLPWNRVIPNRHIIEDASTCGKDRCVGGIASREAAALGGSEPVKDVVRRSLPPGRHLINERHDSCERRCGSRGAADEGNIKLTLTVGLTGSLQAQDIRVE
jgi:hypothetical protein